MSSPTLLTPSSKLKPLTPFKAKHTTCSAASSQSSQPPTLPRRRQFLSLVATIVSPALLSPGMRAWAASDEEYVKETSEVINKVRTTLTMEKNDPDVAEAVADLREKSNSWVAKYRREDALIGKASYRDIYSALNAVCGHYISFGPTAPIPAKRKARILEEMDTAEKALLRGR